MRRAVALLMLFLVAGSATGAFAAAGEEASCDDCGEGDNGCCPPVCPQCICVARGVTADMPKVILVLPAPIAADVADHGEERAVPESADPQEILHIPKHVR